ncbi:MAG: DsrE/DsrF/DrsH-like family protein [Actinobacteria bacterium]|nr:DsrE/DsrF/DrsH-like family protein [Actinomycetota bacterium]
MSDEAEKATIVVFSGELDRALAAFNIATTAASMGMEVTLFFTFWGLNVVTREKAATAGRKSLQKMMGMMNRGGARRLKLSRLNMLGGGKAAMKRLMKEYRMPSLEEMIPMAKELGVRFLACTTSMALMGLGEEDFIPEVDEFVGAATYVEKAAGSSINLFI